MWKERKKEKVSKERKKRKRQAIFLNVTSCAIGAIATYYYKYIFKEPCMTSRQKGENWVHEILNGHPARCLICNKRGSISLIFTHYLPYL
jgi:membrane protein YqaA with SNARE-associated domain